MVVIMMSKKYGSHDKKNGHMTKLHTRQMNLMFRAKKLSKKVIVGDNHTNSISLNLVL
jgi:hypothetical protein